MHVLGDSIPIGSDDQNFYVQIDNGQITRQMNIIPSQQYVKIQVFPNDDYLIIHNEARSLTSTYPGDQTWSVQHIEISSDGSQIYRLLNLMNTPNGNKLGFIMRTLKMGFHLSQQIVIPGFANQTNLALMRFSFTADAQIQYLIHPNQTNQDNNLRAFSYSMPYYAVVIRIKDYLNVFLFHEDETKQIIQIKIDVLTSQKFLIPYAFSAQATRLIFSQDILDLACYSD
ncbi:UNKNOWN [Stylonychia lemnae]|uniref:Uncharacterized protein n=1 Tax=Stylonychia lemnae TaxID=5949 RepID=A0A078A558_STYLE|nr:UNKNOWN [Stylonychia lemnae]|eukprot:CDW77009.1 UNKNOWN [Stylonychia lemnae]